ncbi:NTE family protein [Trujillonella endophytica]|uniref:NTE family protein n=1 Tax=Trujillonella endophytica TaxID=673521 RepID=A0A1H8QNT2_9ACTN|nr:NTE family protein [Trujillella endophytica]
MIGAGAAVGGAWAAGAVCALTETGAFDPAGPELVVGTSAGSVVAALLAAGMPPRELAGLFSDDRESGTPPVRPELSARVRATLRDVPRPVPIPGNLRLAARTLGRPGHRALRTAAAALAPRGRGDLAPVGELVGAVQGDRTWPARPRTWLVAMDFDSGRRVAFGAPGEPPTSPAEAVMASCSVPGLFAPRFIAGRRYVDGGAVSVTNADVLAGEALDEVVVVAPLVTPGPLPRRSAAARIEHRVRLHIAQRLSWEVWRLLAAGMSVRVLTPTAEDVAAMGVDRMDAGRHRRVFETAVRTTTAQLAAEAPPAAAHAEIDGVA